jgi:predicted Rossmann-fold nucleotide-binding protein
MYTGMGRKGRNVILVRSADACIFLGGGMGTLNEFTIAFDDLDHGTVIGILSESGGFSGEYVRLASYVDRSSRATILWEKDPLILVERVFEILEQNCTTCAP